MENTIIAELNKLGPVDPLNFSLMSIVDRVTLAIRKDISTRQLRRMDDFHFNVNLSVNLHTSEVVFTMTIAREEDDTPIMTLTGHSVEELLCDENRAMLYLLLNS